ncbi:hypothetical protein OEA41_010061 [Lepraria neglecta]|uniref:Uncharacterized protein n=1 Tax=Lepraria neglecta TaxID=209136 RepID=A0AAD9YVT6_9LECA|nr:hypothetical protein OEA41_010061 [Lepraria neglecta]
MADQTLTALYRSPEVANPVNPSAFGYHHGQYILNMQRAYAEYELQGPIPNNNVGWVPAVQAAAIAASDASIAAGNGALRESSPAKVQHMLSMTSHSTNSPNPPNAAVDMSSVNGGVCMISMGNMMCGAIHMQQPSMRRHQREKHPGALTNPTRGNASNDEQLVGMNRRPIGQYIDLFASECERLARNDARFGAGFAQHMPRMRKGVSLSTEFVEPEEEKPHTRHIPPVTTDAQHMLTTQQPTVATPSSRSRKRGPSPPRRDRDESPSPSSRATARKDQPTSNKRPRTDAGTTTRVTRSQRKGKA